MATNKNAIIRYHALDQCFSNTGRIYFIEDLLEACNEALYEYTGISDGIKRRQIFNDINFMESEQGWSIPLEKNRELKKVYYRYADRNFSIKNQPINESELNQLKETVLILDRFKGMPQFEVIEELIIRLESKFNIKEFPETIVDFEQNPYLKGLNFFTELFNAIRYKKVLIVNYQSFKQDAPSQITIHPYYLKQFNNRWFLFAYNETQNAISNISLDRISKIKEKQQEFIENKKIDFQEYFDDVVGVTVNEEEKAEKVLLQISKELCPYIETKPIHGSQKIKERNNKGVLFEFLLQINYELISLILSFGEEVTVIEPESLRNTLKNKVRKLLENYS